MKIRFRGRDGGIVVCLINAKDLEKHRARHHDLEIDGGWYALPAATRG